MEVARTTAQAHQQLLTSNHLRTDFVVMVLYGLMRQSQERLEEVIEQYPCPVAGIQPEQTALETQRLEKTKCLNESPHRREPGGTGCVGWNFPDCLYCLKCFGRGSESHPPFQSCLRPMISISGTSSWRMTWRSRHSFRMTMPACTTGNRYKDEDPFLIELK